MSNCKIHVAGRTPRGDIADVARYVRERCFGVLAYAISELVCRAPSVVASPCTGLCHSRLAVFRIRHAEGLEIPIACETENTVFYCPIVETRAIRHCDVVVHRRKRSPGIVEDRLVHPACGSSSPRPVRADIGIATRAVFPGVVSPPRRRRGEGERREGERRGLDVEDEPEHEPGYPFLTCSCLHGHLPFAFQILST